VRYFFIILGIGVFILIDVLSKAFFQIALKTHAMTVWKIIQFKLVFNTGVAFSIPLHGLLQIIITILLLIFVSIYFFRHYSQLPICPSFGFVLIVGGALGNLYERIFLGKVTDFIQVFSWFPIFNFADVFIFIGVCILFLADWRRSIS
jgi:signal peptidase II